MSDLRKAAEMALKYFEDAHGLEDTEVAIREALRQALAQPEQEPVGYVTDSGKSAYILLGVDLEDDTPLYTAPPQKKEEGCAQCGKQASQGWALYCVECAGGKREWVGLTSEEARAIRLKVGSAADVYAVAIEEALKEKNT